MSIRNLQPGKGKTVAPYTPAITESTNLGTLTLLNAFFVISGDLVTVHAAFTTNPTVAATTFSFEMSLPFPIDVTGISDIIGVAGNGLGPEFGGNVIGSIANDTALVASRHSDNDGTTTVSFSYRTDT